MPHNVFSLMHISSLFIVMAGSAMSIMATMTVEFNFKMLPKSR